MTQSDTTGPSSAVAIVEPFSRVSVFFKRHGFRATLRRSVVSLRRLLSSNRMVVFCYDFPKSCSKTTNSSDDLKFERKRNQSEIAPGDLQKMLDFWNPVLCRIDFCERFRQGASLWLVWSGENLAGYGWTITGQTLGPYYHPFSGNDVHLFDFLVFPEFRGRNVNPSLVDHILQQMSEEGRTRAYIEVREWNRPQLCSLRKTKFQLLGVARKASFFGRTFVEWSRVQI
jgi:ribosomal protein S18 acetylase RimI-like enzyme